MLQLQNGVLNQLFAYQYYGFTGPTITKTENNPTTWNLQFTEKSTKLSFLVPKTIYYKSFDYYEIKKKYYKLIDAYEISAMNKMDYKSSTCLKA